MNYLKELNAFYDRLETNPVSSSAIALWHALMSVNNKAGWMKEFTVAAPVLCLKSGLKDSTFKKARNELMEKGYIFYTSRRGNQSALYQLPCLSSTYDHNRDQSDDDNCSENGVCNPIPLNKQNKTKENKNILPPQLSVRSEENPFSLYQQEIGNVTETIKDSILDWLESNYFDEPEALIMAAIKEAVIHEKRSWAYIDTVLRRCLQQHIRTVAELQQKKQEYAAQKHQKVTPFPRQPSPKQTESLPPLIVEQMKRQKTREKAKPEQSPPEESYEEQRKRVDELLKVMGEK